MKISFAGCGFMGVYHIGVGHCLFERTPELLDQMDGCYGTSAGAIVAVCMAVNARTEDGNRFVVKATNAVNKSILGAFHPGFDPGAHIEEFLEDVLPPNAHREVRGKVRISVTELPTMKNRIIGDFNTRKELIKAVVGSSFIPCFSGYVPPIFRGKRVVDGGFSDNIPHAKDIDDVITVSPFPGDFDICPEEDHHHNMKHFFHVANMQLQFNVHNWWRIKKCFFSPSMSELRDIQREGYRDTLRFLKTRGLISEPILRPYMALKDCIPLEFDTEVEKEDDPQLEEKDGVGGSSHYWLQLEKVALTNALDLPLSRAHVGCSQSSDYFSDTSSPDSLSRSISSSNVSELGIGDDLTDLEDAEMLSSFLSTRALCSRRRSDWTFKELVSPRVVSYLCQSVYATVHAKDKQYDLCLFERANNLWRSVLQHATGSSN